MTRLPEWAANEAARALLATILADPPETRLHRDHWGSRTIYRAWKRPDVAALKRMFTQWWNANYATATELPEDPDALIGRLLAEGERADLEPKEIDGGRFQVAA